MCLICRYTPAELEEVRPGILPLPALSTDNPRESGNPGVVCRRSRIIRRLRSGIHPRRSPQGIVSMLDIGDERTLGAGSGPLSIAGVRSTIVGLVSACDR